MANRNGIIPGQVYRDKAHHSGQRVVRVGSEESDGRFACQVVIDADGRVPQQPRWSVIRPETLAKGYELIEGEGEL